MIENIYFIIKYKLYLGKIKKHSFILQLSDSFID